MTDLHTAHDHQGGQEPALDFEAMYQGREVAFGAEEDRRTDVIPWQLDAPQPLVVELEAAGEITGPVLECGCGLGDNALFLAGRGHEVTAFDAAPSAIERCRAKAVAAGSPVTFMVADATELHASGVPGGFRTVVDSAMLHCLDVDQRRAYLAGLRQVCAPGATLHVLCFRGELAAQLQMPAATDERSLREALRDDWTIRRMEPRHYATGLTQQEWQKLAPVVPGDSEQADLVTVDENGRVLLPFWQITAELT
ncbi:class I SAM-dependent methyltransferase [Streptomyces noursei]|uniref:class I SAM-dependent methyltransferase n=1 Tax=Streptomyces noursei TaxID=1971 RepID=UPI0016795140|nr:class I SAM-dependent methyltransferase [Streptomyces noursei]MCZ1020989.1 class I SAM-dependent methyltransferase [Streptomyces noursei]GGX48495.1 transferase [Streptomyces noursei]